MDLLKGRRYIIIMNCDVSTKKWIIRLKPVEWEPWEVIQWTIYRDF